MSSSPYLFADDAPSTTHAQPNALFYFCAHLARCFAALLRPQVFIQMYRHHPQFHVLLEGMDTDPDPVPQNGNGGQVVGSNGQPERASSLLAGTFTTAALNALSISEDALPPPEQLLAMMEASGGWLWFLFDVLIGGWVLWRHRNNTAL
jgi:hypothetical protein